MPNQAAKTVGLKIATPTAIAFVDESGSISQDRFFAVGCLKPAEPSDLTRSVQTLRDRLYWYEEVHFTKLTVASAPRYIELIKAISGLKAEFSCFVADRNVSDPLRRFGNPWNAYERLACQLLLGNIHPSELVTVLADNYSTPEHVIFERRLKKRVNDQLGRLAVTSVCRLDSAAADPLQIVDFLTSATAFEFRQAASLASTSSPKAKVADAVRSQFGVGSFLPGWRSPHSRRFSLNVALYRES